MDKQQIKSLIKRYLLEQDEILFAYIFGSFVQNEKYRDIDIAIYTESELQLLQLGLMQANLGDCTGMEVDLISLGNPRDKNPAFVFQVVSRGELLFSLDSEKHTEFKKSVMLYYFDTARLRKNIDQAFTKRLESNKFGARDYE